MSNRLLERVFTERDENEWIVLDPPIEAATFAELKFGSRAYTSTQASAITETVSHREPLAVAPLPLDE